MYVILDNGHGENTPGKRGSVLREYRFNRDVLKYVTYELFTMGIAHEILVPEDNDIPLSVRVRRANKIYDENGNDCFLVSIHGNAYEGESPEKVSGIETWYHSESGKKYAGVFQDELIDELGWRDRGLKRGDFTIIRKTKMIAVLLELGFYTNHREEEAMLDPENQYHIGMAIGGAIEKIINTN